VALQGLEALELKARAMHLCDALEATLPDDFEDAAAIIEAALAPPGEGEDLSALRSTRRGLAGWMLWPLGEYVARRGADTPERALQTLHALTQRFTPSSRSALHRAPPGSGVRHAGQRWTATPAPMCAAWSARAAARACPGGCS
jgi:hypothetical protein